MIGMNEGLIQFVKGGMIERLVWLDGGHNGTEVTWVTEQDVLSTMASQTTIKVDVRYGHQQILILSTAPDLSNTTFLPQYTQGS